MYEENNTLRHHLRELYELMKEKNLDTIIGIDQDDEFQFAITDVLTRFQSSWAFLDFALGYQPDVGGYIKGLLYEYRNNSYVGYTVGGKDNHTLRVYFDYPRRYRY